MITKIGVIGAGQMGSGIAQVAASAGYFCMVTDSRKEALLLSRESIEKSLHKLSAKNLIKDEKSIIERLTFHDNISALSSCDLVIEAVVEKEEVKIALFKNLDELLNKDAIIASNTSSISITRLASVTKRPALFIGMHFMNPVPLMKLVEIIRGNQTSDSTVEAIRQVAERMDKVTTIARDFPGFIANRILMPMINEAFFALMEGVASKEDIDVTMKLGCNFPMGPLSLADFIGLDTCLAITEVLHKGLGEDKYRPCPLLRQYVEAGKLGKKTSEGVYTYA